MLSASRGRLRGRSAGEQTRQTFALVLGQRRGGVDKIGDVLIGHDDLSHSRSRCGA